MRPPESPTTRPKSTTRRPAPARSVPWSTSPGSAIPRRRRRPMRDGRRPSSQRQAWQPRSQNARVASVVASLDSATASGAVAMISAARQPPLGPSMRRPSHQTPSTVPAPASEETSRTPKGLSPPDRRREAHQPVDQDRLVIARLAVERREKSNRRAPASRGRRRRSAAHHDPRAPSGRCPPGSSASDSTTIANGSIQRPDRRV